MATHDRDYSIEHAVQIILNYCSDNPGQPRMVDGLHKLHAAALNYKAAHVTRWDGEDVKGSVFTLVWHKIDAERWQAGGAERFYEIAIDEDSAPDKYALDVYVSGHRHNLGVYGRRHLAKRAAARHHSNDGRFQ